MEDYKRIKLLLSHLSLKFDPITPIWFAMIFDDILGRLKWVSCFEKQQKHHTFDITELMFVDVRTQETARVFKWTGL